MSSENRSRPPIFDGIPFTSRGTAEQAQRLMDSYRRTYEKHVLPHFNDRTHVREASKLQNPNK